MNTNKQIKMEMGLVGYYDKEYKNQVKGRTLINVINEKEGITKAGIKVYFKLEW